MGNVRIPRNNIINYIIISLYNVDNSGVCGLSEGVMTFLISRYSNGLLPVFGIPNIINRLTPNDPHMGHTAPLTSKRCILCIYSTNIGTEYFKHALYSPFLM